jgi:hypothetical protein
MDKFHGSSTHGIRRAPPVLSDRQFEVPSLQQCLLLIAICDAFAGIRFDLEFTLPTDVTDMGGNRTELGSTACDFHHYFWHVTDGACNLPQDRRAKPTRCSGPSAPVTDDFKRWTARTREYDNPFTHSGPPN